MSKIGIPKVVVHTFTTLVNSIPNMAQLRQAGKTAYKIAYMPWNGICKNMHYDLRSGSANFFWKYPLICAACAYPVGFYYHENHRVNEKRHLLALGIRTQYDIDFAAGKYPVEDC